jgi:hypothetical protein
MSGCEASTPLDQRFRLLHLTAVRGLLDLMHGRARPAADHVSVVDDDMGNTTRTLRQPALLPQTNLIPVLPAGQDFAGDFRIKTGDCRGAHEDIAVGDALLPGEGGRILSTGSIA